MPFPAIRTLLLAGAVAAAMAGCAPAPVLKPAAMPIEAAADSAAVAEDRYRDAVVVWGGRIVDIRNRADVTEIVVDAYPLDGGQRPQPDKDGHGCFVAVLPGYVESRDYRAGRFISVTGTLGASVMVPAAEGDRSCASVGVAASHLWPPGFPNTGPQVHFAVGVSGGIR